MNSFPSLLRFFAMYVMAAMIAHPASVFAEEEVEVETIEAGNGPLVSRSFQYRSHVTLYIENRADKSRSPSGWSTRREDGAAADEPFEFTPGVGLIRGWTAGVLKMREGERALLHVPYHLGYGDRPMGSPGGSFYIPANSDLLFDIEILGKAGGHPAEEEF